MKGAFITLEGADGVGKTTQMKYVVNSVQQAGFTVVQTREPGGTQLGERVRELVKKADYYAIGADTETLLIFAARAQHIEEVIAPALACGKWVVCDRFTDATYAYQGAGRGLGRERIAVLEQWTQGDLRPDLTLFFDLTPKDNVVAPRQTRDWVHENSDRFEQEDLTFKQKLYECYLASCNEQPDRIKRIDAAQSIQAVAQETQAALAEFIQQRNQKLSP